MPWLQLVINTRREQIESLEDALLKVGAASVTLQEHIPNGQNEQAILEPGLGETPLWDHACLTALFDANCDINNITLQLESRFSPPPSLHWEQLEDKDWEREWMQHYQPIQCAENLWICPSWQSPPDPQATNLLLDPGLAFGTGTHPTTFLCMQWLAEQDLNQKIVIDYGCGSGILGITALLLKAEQVIGVDIDPQALIATRDNLQRNRLDNSQLPVFLPNEAKLQKEQADMLVANILAGPLVELAGTLLAPLKPGGKLCLSGILEEQASQVMAAYQDEIAFEPIATKDGWVRLSGQRRS